MSIELMRRVAVAAATLAAIAAGTDGVSAKPKGKVPAQRAPAAVAAVTAVAAAAAPAAFDAAPRYFTINQVLRARSGAPKDAPIRLASLDPSITLRGSLSDLPDAQPAANHEPFGLTTFRAPEGLLWVKWRAVERSLSQEADIVAACRNEPASCSSPAALAFIALVNDAGSRDGRARIEVVNRTINTSVRYMSDYAQHGMPDLWSSPLATLASGHGDCEDYAIAKFVALREAGVPADHLRLVLVRDRAVRQDHAVLAVRHGDKWLILDNRHLRVDDAQDIGNFTPLFAINERGVQLFARPYAGAKLRSDTMSDAALAEIGSADASWAAIDETGISGSNTTPYLL